MKCTDPVGNVLPGSRYDPLIRSLAEADLTYGFIIFHRHGFV